MAEYKIYFRTSVEKDFSAVPKKDLQRILHRIEALATDPRPPGAAKLTGQERYRIRQGGQDCIFHSGQATYGVDSEGGAQKRHLPVKRTRCFTGRAYKGAMNKVNRLRREKMLCNTSDAAPLGHRR